MRLSIFKIGLFAIISLIFTSPVFADIIYSVEKGDSAWSIAVRFGIGLEELYIANDWAEDEDPVLQIGQRIVVPSDRDDETVQDADSDAETPSDEPSDTDEVTLISPETTYLVQSGDNPYNIAHKFGIGTLVLLEYNGLVEGDLIHPGQLLKIPPGDYDYLGNSESSNDNDKTSPEPLRYPVGPGDNMWLIARKFSINLQSLLAFNNLNERSVLQVGDEVLIPIDTGALPSRSMGWSTYIIVSGDTISEIAQKHGVSLAVIMEANNLTANSTLRPGQEIKIPGYRSSPPEIAGAPESATHNPVEDLTPLPKIDANGSGDPPDWHSEIFDFRNIELPAPSTPAAGESDSSGGYSIDGHFSDGDPWHKYTIRRGDTISYVAQAFGVTQSELMDRNGLDIRTPLRIGRDLKIPLPKTENLSRPSSSGGSGSRGAKGTIGDGTGTASGRALVEEAMKYMGTPYRWAGTSLTGGVDCSGFVYSLMSMFGVDLPRRSRDMASAGTEVGYDELTPGDLVFFHTTRSGISHVGIYIGGGEFIHSSSHRGGVVINPLDSGYYRERFVTARRFF